MKIILLIVLLALTGCSTASVSEYNQGCRDGVRTFVQEVYKAGIDDSVLAKGCDNVEAHFRPPKPEHHFREGPR